MSALGLVAAVLWPAATAAVEFDEESIPTSSTPTAMQAADVTGDGRLDIVSSDLFTQARFLRGKANGSFTDPTPITATTAAGGLDLARFGPDADLDLLLADGPNDELDLFGGNGLGDFVPLDTEGVEDAPADAEAADFNGDGNMDAASVNGGGASVSIAYGRANGQLRSPTSYPVASPSATPSQMAVGRLAGNALPDVVTADQAGLSVFVSRANGSLKPAEPVEAGLTPYVVTTGRLAGDRSLDIAAGNFNGGDVSVLEGDGSGGFEASDPLAVGGEITAVAAGDLTGDGRADLVAAEQSNETISVFVRRRGGGFRPEQELTVPANPTAVVIADFDRRRGRDIAVSALNGLVGGNGQLTVFLNRG
jgi:hypothetical protein